MKKTLFTLSIFVLHCINISAQGSTKIYDSFVQMYLNAPSKVVQGKDFTICVTFRQTSTAFPFNKNGNMAKVPVFPAIEGFDRLGEPKVVDHVDENKNAGKTVSKTYTSTFFYEMNAVKAGKYSIDGVRILFRGHVVKAKEQMIEVTPTFVAPTLDVALQLQDEQEIQERTIVYENPFVQRKTSPRAFVNALKVYKDRTEVEMSYTAKGEEVWVSSECYIENNDTKERVKLRLVKGSMSFDKQYVRSGVKLNYTMVFPPIDKSWRNINLLENTAGGFSFYGIGLSSKSDRNEGVSTCSQVVKVNWSDMRRVELNNYSSDFLFTDGLVPIYDKDLHKWGFFDEKGNQVVQFVWDYDDFSYPHFSGGYCIVSKERKVDGFYYTDYYSINRTGQPVKLNGVEKVTLFCDGLAAVVKKGGKYTYIRGNGGEAFPALNQYIGSKEPKHVRPFEEGLSAYFDYSKNKYGFINKQGRWVIPAQFDDVHDFCEGLAAVKVPQSKTSPAQWGFINNKGEMMIAAQYSYEPTSFSKGRAVVKKRSGMEVMIDTKGTVVSPEFDDLFPFFSTGYALAQQPNSSGFYIIDNDYRVTAGPIFGVDYKHPRYKEYHGVFQTPVFVAGYSDSYTYLTTGEPFVKENAWKKMGVMSENLIHFTGSDGDGFIDYQGNVIFQFVKSEF